MIFEVEIQKTVDQTALLILEAKDEDEAYDKAYKLATSSRNVDWVVSNEEIDVWLVRSVDEN